MAEGDLSRILSGDPLPRVPVEEDPDIDKWRRDLVSYLRRLTGKLTNQAISDAAGADVIWEHLDDVQTSIAHVAPASREVFKTVNIPANTIISGGAISIEVWGQLITQDFGVDFPVHFVYGGTDLVQSSAFQGVDTPFWYVHGMISVGINGFILTSIAGNNNAKPNQGSNAVDPTVDQDFTFELDMPAGTITQAVDLIRLRSIATRLP